MNSNLIFLIIYIIGIIASMFYVRKILHQTDFWSDLIICICLAWLLVAFMFAHFLQKIYKKSKLQKQQDQK